MQDGGLSDTTSGTVPSPPGVQPGIATRFVRLFTAPRTAFTPPLSRAVWLVPLILLSVLQAGQMLALQDLQTERIRENIERNERIPEEQREQIIAGIEAGQANPGRQAMNVVSGVAGYWLLVFLIPALLYRLGLGFVLGANVRFRDVFAVTAFSGLILGVRELIRLPIILSTQSLDVYTSPAALAVSEQPALLAGLNTFDVFDLYRLFVLAVGFAAVTALPAKRTAYPVVVVWLLYGLAGVGCMLSPLGQFLR